MSATRELFECGHYSGVVAVCADALEGDPDNLELRLLMARALMALRQDREAKKQLGECLRIRPACARAYQLLGELAFRRDELESAEIFFREALRIAPWRASAKRGLELVLGATASSRPAAAAVKLPASTAAAGRASTASAPPRAASRRVPSVLRPRGIGRYLVEVGMLTTSQLQQAVALHRSTGMRVGTAALALGFIAEPALERAAQDYHSRYKSVA